MVWWNSNLRILLRHAGTKMQQNQMSLAKLYSSYPRQCSSSPGQVLSCHRGSFLSSSIPISHFYRYLQHLDISSSRNLLAEADTNLAPVSSPLTPVLSPIDGTSATSAVSKPSKVQAVLKGIRQAPAIAPVFLKAAVAALISVYSEQGIWKILDYRRDDPRENVVVYYYYKDIIFVNLESPKKVNLVAQLVRGMRVEDALLQLQVTVKRAAKTLYKVIKSARANASHNHGMDPDRLLVAEAFVGKGRYLKRLSFHAKGRFGIMVRPHCRLTVVVRELTNEEESKIAKLKVMNYKKLTKKERQLVPHQLIETMPRWSRRPQNEKPYFNVKA